MALSPEDKAHLDTFEAKLQLVRDRTAGIVLGYGAGIHLWGDGGCGKSYTIIQELDRLKANYKLSNSRLTGRGLFDLLDEFPDAIHVLEDMEAVTRDKNALSVLRSALWSQADGALTDRLVTWRAFKTILRCWFKGGIILIGNRPLDDIPELKAIKTRIPSLHLQPTNYELAALMRSVSMRGFQHGHHRLSPAECGAVCELAIAKCLSADRNLDLRLLVNSFRDYVQWQHGHSETHWQDLLDSRLKEMVCAATRSQPRATRLVREQDLAVKLSQMRIPRLEREQLWEQQTGKSVRAYYRRLAELPPEPPLPP